MTVVVNLFGSAGSGKSTTALGLCYFLKLQGYKVEYVSEYAKDLVNEGSIHKLKHQLYVFSKQLKRMEVLVDKELDFIITDSPILLSYFYGEKYGTSGPLLGELVNAYHKSFVNFNVFLTRAFPYDPKLRVQTEDESDQDSIDLRQFLSNNNIYLDMSIGTTEGRVESVLDTLLTRYKNYANKPNRA
jgi:nicotinamide riboside kinase